MLFSGFSPSPSSKFPPKITPTHRRSTNATCASRTTPGTCNPTIGALASAATIISERDRKAYVIMDNTRLHFTGLIRGREQTFRNRDQAAIFTWNKAPQAESAGQFPLIFITEIYDQEGLRQVVVMLPGFFHFRDCMVSAIPSY